MNQRQIKEHIAQEDMYVHQLIHVTIIGLAVDKQKRALVEAIVHPQIHHIAMVEIDVVHVTDQVKLDVLTMVSWRDNGMEIALIVAKQMELNTLNIHAQPVDIHKVLVCALIVIIEMDQ